MQLEARLRQGLSDGTVDVCFRRWLRPQVVAGRRYRTMIGFVAVDECSVVEESDLTADDIRRAGYADLDSLRADLRPPEPGRTLYRVVLRRVDAPDPRAELAASDELTAGDRAAIERRLARYDDAAATPWTRAVLQTIADRPGVRAPDLAESFGRETLPFKRDVRKLKELGLTLSLAVGYRLSPRGEAYLRGCAAPPAASTGPPGGPPSPTPP